MAFIPDKYTLEKLKKAMNELEKLVRESENHANADEYSQELEKIISSDEGLKRLMTGVISEDLGSSFAMPSKMNADYQFKLVDFEELRTYLAQLMEDGHDQNFLIISLDETKNYYLQFRSAKGANSVVCEAVSNNYLKEINKISEEHIQYLRQKGWMLPANEEENFCKVVERTPGSIEQVMEEIKKVASFVYGVPALDKVSIKIELS